MKIVEDTYVRSRRGLRSPFKLMAEVNGEIVGHVMVHSERYARHAAIYRISIDKDMRRTGIGTALYEAAARLSCQRFKKPLASDNVRSPMADQFWRKQYIKQRAHCSRWIKKPGAGRDAQACIAVFDQQLKHVSAETCFTVVRNGFSLRVGKADLISGAFLQAETALMHQPVMGAAQQHEGAAGDPPTLVG